MSNPIERELTAALGGGESRRSSRRRSTASTSESKVCKHPAGATVDAATIKREELKRIVASNETKLISAYLACVDFVSMSDNDIEHLFVTDRLRDRDKGQIIFPPKTHRRTCQQIRGWFRDLGSKQKNELIEDAAEYEIQIDHDIDLFWDGQQWAYPPKLPEDESYATAPSDPNTASDGDLKQPIDGPKNPVKYCMGVTMDYIQQMKVDEARKNHLCLGFKHAVRESLTTRSAVSQPDDDKWKYSPPVVGAILDGNDTSIIRWRVEEQQHADDADQFEFMSIHATGCTHGELEGRKTLCGGCTAARKRLFERFDSHVKLRTEEFNPNTRHNILGRSGSLQKKNMKYHSGQSRGKSKKIKRRDAVIETLKEQTGVDVKVNKASDFVFCDDVQKATESFLKAKLGPDSIAAYAFARSVHNHKVAKKSGATAVRHCPLMIRLGAIVRKQMGHAGGLFDLVAKIAGFPSERQLRRYTVTNSNDPDGIMHGNCSRAKVLFDQKFPNAGRFDYKRHAVVAFDSMHTKQRFGVSRNTNEIVAVSEDAFDDAVIENELKMLNSNAANEEEDAEIKLPGRAKHFLVFIATTWTTEGKIQFLVARYGKASITSFWLHREIKDVIMALCFYGFIVDTIAGDGASENRAAFKMLATISAKKILKGIFSDDELKGLHLNFKIAFPHPHRLYRDKVKIVIGGEMPSGSDSNSSSDE